MQNMRTDAVLFTAKNQVEFGQVDVPDPTPREVVNETRYSWISSGTEGSFLRCECVDGITPWQVGLPLPFPMVPSICEAKMRFFLGPWSNACV